MKKILVGSVVIGMIAASGCATVDTAYGDSKRAADANGEAQLVTGTRLVKPTTERVVKGVGNNEYNDTNQNTSISNSAAFKKGN